MNGLAIDALMQRNVATVGMDDCAADVERVLGERHLTWVPVLEGGTAVGVVSAADLLRMHAEGRNPKEVRAWQLCSYRPVTVRPGTPVRDVARLMLERQIHHVVVAGEEGIEGVVSALDFVRWAASMPASAAGGEAA